MAFTVNTEKDYQWKTGCECSQSLRKSRQSGKSQHLGGTERAESGIKRAKSRTKAAQQSGTTGH
jgi:hypothetical protein